MRVYRADSLRAYFAGICWSASLRISSVSISADVTLAIKNDMGVKIGPLTDHAGRTDLNLKFGSMLTWVVS